MKEYKNTHCIEGDYFTCPETIPPNAEEPKEEDIISQNLPLSTDNYQKSGVTKKSYKLYEK